MIDGLNYRSFVVRLPVGAATDSKPVKLHDVLRAVESVTRIGMLDLKGPYRRGGIARARHIYYWVARRRTGKSFPQIGYYCGGRDHSTVMHGVDKVEGNRVAFEPELSHVLAVLR